MDITLQGPRCRPRICVRLLSLFILIGASCFVQNFQKTLQLFQFYEDFYRRPIHKPVSASGDIKIFGYYQPRQAGRLELSSHSRPQQSSHEDQKRGAFIHIGKTGQKSRIHFLIGTCLRSFLTFQSSLHFHRLKAEARFRFC